MAETDYAGLYFGIDDLGYTVGLYKPDGTCAHFISLENSFYGTITGLHKLEANLIHYKIRPLLAPEKIIDDEAFLYLGDRIVHDNSGTWASDFIEYFIEGYDSFWDRLDIDNLPLGEDGELLDIYASKLQDTLQKGLDIAGKKQEKPKEKEKEREKEPVKPKEEPPYVLVYIPSDSPLVEPKGEEEAEEKKRNWRKKRKTKDEDASFIDGSYECQEFEALFAIEGEDKLKTKDFSYVFVIEKQVWITSFYANIFIFCGLTRLGQVEVLFAFISGEKPWEDMLKLLAIRCRKIDYFIYRDYNNIVESKVKEVFKNTKYYDSIWSLGQDPPMKDRMEEAYRVIDRETNNFWARPGEVTTTSLLQDALEGFMVGLSNFFVSYSFESKLIIIPDLNLVSSNSNSTKEIGTQSAKDELNSYVNYCFVYETQIWLAGGIQRRLASFNQISRGQINKIIVIALDESHDNRAWEEAIKRAKSNLDTINYILFRGCSINTFTIDKSILTDTVWCSSIGDFDMNEEYRMQSNEKLNRIENHLVSFIANGKDLEDNCLLLEKHINKLKE